MKLTKKLKKKYNEALVEVLKYYELNLFEYTREYNSILYINISKIVKNATYDAESDYDLLIEKYEYLGPFWIISQNLDYGKLVVSEQTFKEINEIIKKIRKEKK